MPAVCSFPTRLMPDLVEVIWDDAWARKDDEVTLDDVASSHIPTVVTTIGWLLLDDAKGVSIANEHFESTYRGRTFIPRAMVRSITPIKRARLRARRAVQRPSSSQVSLAVEPALPT